MNHLVRLLPILLCLALGVPAQAADKSAKVKPSKVSSAKSRDREKLFTDWLNLRDMESLIDAKGKMREQMVYFEYHEGKDAYRGIFSKAVMFSEWLWLTISGEEEMQKDVTTYKGRGYDPLFVVEEGNYYRVLFVKSAEVAEARKVIKEFGIEAPVVK